MKKPKSQIYLFEEVRNQNRQPGEDEFYFPVLVHDYNGNKIPARLSHGQISTVLKDARRRAHWLQKSAIVP